VATRRTTATVRGNGSPRRGLPAPAADWALFLDVDGTLLDIAPRPDQVVVGPEVGLALTGAMQALGGAVALVSGRSIAQLDELFAPVHFPAAGLHGLERRLRPHAVTRVNADLPGLADVRAAFARLAGEHPGLLVEDKGLAVALHYRGAPAVEEVARAVARAVVAAHPTLQLLEGKMVLEAKPAGVSKGTVVEAFMTEPPFSGRLPVFVGDDVTDEDGFAVVNRMGGVSIRVGPPPPQLAVSAAAWQCDSVAQFIAWLADLPRRVGAA
jgi:trehalose 6-phosphate phosphatase